jgi:hypothetical protein
MDVDSLSKAELSAWLNSKLDQGRLVAGGLDPPFTIFRARATDRPGWEHVGTASSPLLTIDSLQAAAYETLAEFLLHEPEAGRVVRELDMLLLADAAMRDGGIVSTFDGAHRSTPAAAIAVLTPAFPRYDIPEWARRLRAPPIIVSEALADDQLVFVHSSRRAEYLIEPIADIHRNGPESVLYLRAALQRPRGQQRVSMTRFRVQ